MKAVAELHLVTGHDCLARNLHLIEVLIEPCCMLCNLREPMDCTLLIRCPILCSKSLLESYWEDREKV
ncbi:hypothetical protein TNIN_471821 [Trichonephila inaurata madagascariensis]|uniref:Uncharacterized protein n=1 Tax=Trichonephila inaurata madagascariensis TaxID=2747483 RepID=A0A8X6X7Y8_9ARAC|nr:hypothetical protein TNIN_471821 [Trichonephila inaurata madagascariensis]